MRFIDQKQVNAEKAITVNSEGITLRAVLTVFHSVTLARYFVR